MLLALAAVALVVAGCGGDSSKDARKVIDDAFKHSIPRADVKLELEASVEGLPQLQEPVKLTVSGPYQSNGKSKLPSLDWDVSIAGGGTAFTGGVVSTGDNAFVVFQNQPYEVGEDEVAKLNERLGAQSPQSKSLKELGINPQDWVKSPKLEDDEEVNGVDTQHVTAGVDVKKMLADFNKTIEKTSGAMGASAPREITEEQIAQADKIVKDPKFELWVGKDDKTIRRMTVDVKFDIPDDQQTQLQGASGGEFKFSIDFNKVGDKQTINAPDNPKPLEELKQQIQGLSGGSGVPGLGG